MGTDGESASAVAMHQGFEASDKLNIIPVRTFSHCKHQHKRGFKPQARFFDQEHREGWREIDACLDQKNKTHLILGSFQTLQLTELERCELSSQIW